MGKIAYELREDYAGTVEQKVDGETRQVNRYLGGVINIGAEDLDVREALDNGGGTIVVDDRDPRISAALDAYPPLKRAEVPEGAEPIAGDYDAQNATALRDELKRRGIVGAGSLTKDDAVRALERLDEVPALGGTHVNEVLAVGDGDDGEEG